MNFNRIISLILIIVVGSIIFYTLYELSGNQANKGTDEDYTSEVEIYRAQKNRYLKTNKESPLTPEAKASFMQLDYYPVDTSYRLEARFKPATSNAVLKIPMTDGSSEEYINYGTLTFELKGETHQLTLLKSFSQEEVFFLGFYDPTNGQGTYEGGRYVEPELLDYQTFLIDFNMAYNPYCAYTHDYSCPLPPPENRISQRVEAGEKSFSME